MKARIFNLNWHWSNKLWACWRPKSFQQTHHSLETIKQIVKRCEFFFWIKLWNGFFCFHLVKLSCLHFWPSCHTFQFKPFILVWVSISTSAIKRHIFFPLLYYGNCAIFARTLWHRKVLNSTSRFVPSNGFVCIWKRFDVSQNDEIYIYIYLYGWLKKPLEHFISLLYIYTCKYNINETKKSTTKSYTRKCNEKENGKNRKMFGCASSTAACAL